MFLRQRLSPSQIWKGWQHIFQREANLTSWIMEVQLVYLLSLRYLSFISLLINVCVLVRVVDLQFVVHHSLWRAFAIFYLTY
ncbi:hypothetical protein BS78_07G161700 [Paspalum vaginatum]|nr:hypothetical protein BS78_07G161700 [Paspalum vaginatum]